MYKFIPRSLAGDKGMLRLEPGLMGQALKQTLHLLGSCGCHILDREARTGRLNGNGWERGRQ